MDCRIKRALGAAEGGTRVSGNDSRLRDARGFFRSTMSNSGGMRLLLPACGEKGGMRGRRRQAQNRGKAPSPSPLPACGER